MNCLRLIILLFIVTGLVNCSINNKEPHKTIPPTESELVSLSNSILEEKTSLDSSEQIKKVYGSFTSKNKKELLVGVPYLGGRNSFTNLFLLEEHDGKWTYTGWKMNELTSFDTVDVNNDRVQEIKCNNASLVTGGTYIEYLKILSIKDLKADTLYKVYSEDSYGAGPAREVGQIGDTVINFTKISFIDRKGSKLLREVNEIGIIEKRVTEDSIILKPITTEHLLELKNKKYSR